VPDAAYRRHRGHLPSGGTLVLFTDGLVEKRNQSMGYDLAALCWQLDPRP
jgi:serine phosphatase RsbU (regulator of sigma subunit)